MQNNLSVPGRAGEPENVVLNVLYNKLTSENVSRRPKSTISLHFIFIALRIHSSSDDHVYIVD